MMTTISFLTREQRLRKVVCTNMLDLTLVARYFHTDTLLDNDQNFKVGLLFTSVRTKGYHVTYLKAWPHLVQPLLFVAYI